MLPNGPIGVFDSGVGGLSVWREIARQLPHEDTIYIADQAHVPYGPCSQDEIRGYSQGLTELLIELGCKAVIVACNTASAAALKDLRDRFPEFVSIGMEPAVKPASALTQSGVVGIMATPATFQGRLFQATAGRHASHIRLINQVCDGLAEAVERGQLESAATVAMLERYLAPILEAGADTIVLACTHYPFLLPALRRIAGAQITIIDPAPAIARHLADTLRQRNLVCTRTRAGAARFITSGDPRSFADTMHVLLGLRAPVEQACWLGSSVVIETSAHHLRSSGTL